jgi:hypothetical protein
MRYTVRELVESHDSCSKLGLYLGANSELYSAQGVVAKGYVTGHNGLCSHDVMTLKKQLMALNQLHSGGIIAFPSVRFV